MSNAHSPGSAPATRREIFAWAMFDFANSGYTTVVLTAIFNAYFVGVVAGSGQDHDGTATLLWTLATGIANLLVLLSAPVVGAIADHGGKKKVFLLASTIGCVLFTALLALVGPGEVALGMLLLVLSAYMFHTGEDLIAGFLPEIADARDMGGVSGYGWWAGSLGAGAVPRGPPHQGDGGGTGRAPACRPGSRAPSRSRTRAPCRARPRSPAGNRRSGPRRCET